MTALQIELVELWECLVSAGWRLDLTATDAAGLHYNLGGPGRLIVGDRPPIDLLPHTLVIAPRRHALRIEAPASPQAGSTPNVVNGAFRTSALDTVRKFVAGDGQSQVMLICGYFNASYGPAVDLFASFTDVVVEQFDAGDRLDRVLKAALAELVAQEVGMGAMTAALLKQVIVTLLRRALSSMNPWVERLAIFGDPPIARAFAEMVARPGAPHSVLTLSRAGALSRSAFMARFTAAFGEPPMVVLRRVRMRQAALLLTASSLPIDTVAREVGYASRSSFFRAFRNIHGSDPSVYRAARSRTPGGSATGA